MESGSRAVPAEALAGEGPRGYCRAVGVRIRVPLVAVVAFAAFSGVAAAADGATLAADYRFENNLDSSAGGASSLADVHYLGSPRSVFATETVDGVPRSVLRF